MAKSAKSFKQDAAQANPVYQQLINDDAQEAVEVQDELRTQGRKGEKLPRINLAFSPTNYDFIKVMAALHGKNLTQYINDIISAERERNGAAYQKAKEIRDSL